jgi:hypothetical protein
MRQFGHLPLFWRLDRQASARRFRRRPDRRRRPRLPGYPGRRHQPRPAGIVVGALSGVLPA